ncbi:MAG: ATP-dependent helicase PcrA, partial [Acidimicrobiaceae bacterium]|nr:ATP-dependent helicase PcrA [Acidimicrobiaceae bacterium]
FGGGTPYGSGGSLREAAWGGRAGLWAQGGAGGAGSGTGGRVPSAARPAASTGAEQLGLAPGDAVVHARWGEGTVLEVRGEGDRAEASIAFPRQGTKRFLLTATPLKRA